MDRQIDKHRQNIDRQTDKWIDRQTDRQIQKRYRHIQTDRQIQTQKIDK